MEGILGAVLGGGGGGGFGAPPNSFEQSFSGMGKQDGADLFRLMSKAQKYSGSSSRRKKQKAGRYGYMAGQMMQQHGINDPRYGSYHQAASMGSQYGLQPTMVDDFRSGKTSQNRRNRRQQKGRYNSRPHTHNEGCGKKQESGSMFDFFDSDTSSSSSDSD